MPRTFQVNGAPRIVNREGGIIATGLSQPRRRRAVSRRPEVASDGGAEGPPCLSIDPFDDLFLVGRRVFIESQHFPYGILCDKTVNAIIWKEELLSSVEFAGR